MSLRELLKSGVDYAATVAIPLSSRATTIWTTLDLEWRKRKWSLGQVREGLLYVRYKSRLCIWDIRYLLLGPPGLTVRTMDAATPSTGDKGLKKDAIGFSDGLTIALASTAPAYSLAAVIGSIVVIVGFQAPAALLVSFVPMFFIAAAFYYMNRADQDCGTSFSWVTRAIGPQSGWIDRLGDLRHRHPRRRLARRCRGLLHFYELIGAESLVESEVGGDPAGAGADRRDDDDLRDRHRALGPSPEGPDGAARSGRCCCSPESRSIKVLQRRRAAGGSIDPSLSWFNPFEVGGSAP